jgi:hypothetical protein
MNFINGRVEIEVELKYCERCGGLFLRPQGTGGVHCNGCIAALVSRVAAFPRPATHKPRIPRMIKGPKGKTQFLAGTVLIENLHGVAAMEVRP